MNLTTLGYGVENNVATITLDRPESRNALNRAMCDDIVAVAAAARDNAEVRLVLVRANGPVFCAGADLKERKGMSADEVRARRLAALRRLWCARKPADAGHRRRAGAGYRFWHGNRRLLRFCRRDAAGKLRHARGAVGNGRCDPAAAAHPRQAACQGHDVHRPQAQRRGGARMPVW